MVALAGRGLGADGPASVDGPVDQGWSELVAHTALQPDARNRFLLTSARAITRVRVDIYPDGGFARLRVRGELV